jgi:hypothetical protein
MLLRTTARDCLYLNWALPAEQAPPLPAPLRYDSRRHGDRDYIFLSALLFRMTGLRPEVLPLFHLSYPQLTVRTYVLDAEGVPSGLFLRVWVPPWVVPVSRFLGGQPAMAGALHFPPPAEESENEVWHWKAQRTGTLAVSARLSAPLVGMGPELGTVQRTVEFFRRRRVYAQVDGRLRAIDRSLEHVAYWPVTPEIEDAGLLAALWPTVDAERFATPHSAWLCPQIPLTFQLVKGLRLPLPEPRIAAAAEPC